MPSTTSSSVSRLLASSTVITPSLPTFFIASARKRPISWSPLAEMVPTWAISSFEVTFFEFFLSSSTTVSTARSTPRFRSIGFMPAATAFEPSLTMAAASTVAVVVPSPALSEVFDATSFTICAPMFSNRSASSISLATVTPSLVTVGAPHDFSITTLRPRGPSVTLTALARVSTPDWMRARAFSSKMMSLAAIRVVLPLLEHAEDLVLAQDEVIDAVHLDLGAGVLAEEDLVALLHVERHQGAVLEALAGPDREDLAGQGPLLGGVGDDDAAAGGGLLLEALDEQPVGQRTNVHDSSPGDERGLLALIWSEC